MEPSKIEIIKEKYYELGYLQLSELINEDLYDIFLVVKEYGLDDYLFDDELAADIKKDFMKRMNFRQMQEKYHIPANCIVKVMQKYGIDKGKKRWSEEETYIIKNYYNRIPFRDLMSMLIPRSEYSVRKYASQVKLTNDMEYWTPEEEQYLYDNMTVIPTRLIAQNLNRSSYACFAKYKKHINSLNS